MYNSTSLYIVSVLESKKINLCEFILINVLDKNAHSHTRNSKNFFLKILRYELSCRNPTDTKTLCQIDSVPIFHTSCLLLSLLPLLNFTFYQKYIFFLSTFGFSFIEQENNSFNSIPAPFSTTFRHNLHQRFYTPHYSISPLLKFTYIVKKNLFLTLLPLCLSLFVIIYRVLRGLDSRPFKTHRGKTTTTWPLSISYGSTIQPPTLHVELVGTLQKNMWSTYKQHHNI